MKQAAYNYGRVLYELGVSGTAVDEAREIFGRAPELLRVLKSPVASKSGKHRVIDRIFPEEMRNFLKVLCDHQDAAYLEDVFRAYHLCKCRHDGILPATLYYVTKPDQAQLGGMKRVLCETYGTKDVEFTLKEDPGLIGGFVVRVGDVETDWSMKGRLKQLEQILTRR